MAKGKSSGGGGLLSMTNLKKAAFFGLTGAFIYNWLKDKAEEPTKNIGGQVAGFVGFKGPGTGKS